MSQRLVGIFDTNSIRCKYVRDNVDNADIPVYADFDMMLQETCPDIVIVTTIDRYHHEYIIKALEFGCDAITEKPMTIDEEKCNAILDAEKRTGKKVIVTFNYRFAPYATRIKELLKEGAIGKILSVDFEYLLDFLMEPPISEGGTEERKIPVGCLYINRLIISIW